MKRGLDLLSKVWRYSLSALEKPLQLPFVVWQVVMKHVHFGELLRLNRHKAWLKQSDIKTVIDVGAHTGEFASAARAILPKAQIYSFEPLPDCCQKLSQRLNRYGKFCAFCVALGDQERKAEFHRSASPKASSVLAMNDVHKKAFPWTAKSVPITVQIQRLDAYCDKMNLASKILLKIDVQGYEEEVLHGGREVLKSVSYILVETSFEDLYENEASFHDVYSLLLDHGFRYAGSLDQLLSPLDGAILQADALFVREP